jgi:hypothetical protein
MNQGNKIKNEGYRIINEILQKSKIERIDLSSISFFNEKI